MNLRKIIREQLEKFLDDSIFPIDNFEFLGKKMDSNNNTLWKYTKKEDSYTFNIYIAETPNKNWYYKIFVYWKKHTQDFTSGKGKDFDLKFGPFISQEALYNDLVYQLNRNILFAHSNYHDDNSKQLEEEIFRILEKIKPVYHNILLSDNSYFEDLKEILPHLFKNKEQVSDYIEKHYKYDDEKQQLIQILNKVDSLRNLTDIDKTNSLF